MSCVFCQLELANNVTHYGTCLYQTFSISAQTLWSRYGCQLSHEPLWELQSSFSIMSAFSGCLLSSRAARIFASVRCSLCSKCFLFSSFNYLFQCSCIRKIFNHEAGNLPKEDGVRSTFFIWRYEYKMILLALRGTLTGLRNGRSAISRDPTKGKTKSCT